MLHKYPTRHGRSQLQRQNRGEHTLENPFDRTIWSQFWPSLSAESEVGSVCGAPIPQEMPATASPEGLVCQTWNLLVKIDDMKAVSWPRNESVKIDGLDLIRRHRAIISCDGKPQQSFGFRFSEFKTRKLCLFLNDFYKTVQLGEDKQAPWCKCK
jgi:hypothetical protein